MQLIPQIESVTTLQRNHTHIFDMLDNGPVILTQHSTPKAVIVSSDEWNEMANELDQLRHRDWCDRVSIEMDQDPSTQIHINSKDEWLALNA